MDDNRTTAELFARHAHRGQMINQRLYGHHLERVVSIVRDAGYHGKWIDAGWLHAVLHKTAVTQQELRREFGEWVYHIADTLTPTGNTAAQSQGNLYAAISQFPDAATIAVAQRIALMEQSKSQLLSDSKDEFFCHVGYRVRLSLQQRLQQSYRVSPVKDGLR